MNKFLSGLGVTCTAAAPIVVRAAAQLGRALLRQEWQL